MMITITVQGCEGNKGDGPSDPLFDHTAVKVWLDSRAQRAFLDLQTLNQVMSLRNCILCRFDAATQFQH